MNDDTRLDAQVRSALAELPVPDDAHTSAALRDVLRRGHAERRQPRWLAPTLVAAAVVSILALVGTLVHLGAGEPPEPAPSPSSQLVGDWQRVVDSDEQPEWSGNWLVTFDSGGVLVMRGPATAAESSDGASYAVTGGQVRVDVFVNNACSEQPAGVYGWSRSGDVLTLTLIEDPCAARVGLFAGSWRRA